MNRTIIAGALAFVFSGCAGQKVDPAMAEEAKRPLVCANKAQCDLYWQRAQVWVAQNSRYRIQSATDAVLTTYGPMGSNTDLAFQILKIPNADGSSSIRINASCDNIFGCFPPAIEGISQFKRYVGTPN